MRTNRARWLTLGVSLLGLLALAGSAAAEGISESGAAPAAQKFVRFGGSNPGGSWFATVGGLAPFLSERIPGLNVTAVSTGGSVDNNRLARKGELDTWLTHALTAYENWTGTGAFKDESPWKGERLLCGVYENHHHFVTLARSNIHTIDDLRGKRVALGSAGSGGAENSANIFQAIGIWDTIEPMYLTWEATGQALLDGKADAIGASSAPLPIVVEIEAQREIRLLELTDQQFKQVIAKYPSYKKGFIQPGTYKAVTRPSAAISFMVYWAAHQDADADAVYKMLAVAFDPANKEALGNVNVNLKTLAPELEAMSSMGIPLHPGAVKFWRDKGLPVPAGLIPPEMR